jgi:hypothetical protein
MKRRIMKGRGISTFIAVLLLMVLAVSAGVVIYAYTMGFLGGLGGSQTPGAFSLDSASCDVDVATAFVRNIGKGTLTLDKAYIDGMEATDEGYSFKVDNGTLADNPITEGAVGKVTLEKTDGFEVGKTYEIKLVARDNTQLTFTVKCK